MRKVIMSDFISEDDLNTVDGYLRYQGVDRATTAPDVLAQYLDEFDKAIAKKAATPPMGVMDLERPGQHLYAVAVREGVDLWLTLWVRRAPKGDVYVFVPRADRDWNPHVSYHNNGNFHAKSFDHRMSASKRQPLVDTFKGCEHLGVFSGHGPKSIGAVCDPAMFSGIVEVAPGILGPRDGIVALDLVEPGAMPHELLGPFTHEQVFKDSIPWIVVRVGKQPPLGC